jgi:NADH:ubiquinone oxidoreductase subunit 6 (subunit J)
MEITIVTVAFVVFALISLGGAIGVVTCQNLFRGTIWLMVSLFGAAGFFVLLSAPFLASVQVLVYIGAIAILFTFAVMLTRSISNLKLRYLRVRLNIAAAVALFALLVVGVIIPAFIANGVQQPVSDVTLRTIDLGEAFAAGGGFALPFEVASLLLTAAMIGAIVIAREANDEV